MDIAEARSAAAAVSTTIKADVAQQLTEEEVCEVVTEASLLALARSNSFKLLSWVIEGKTSFPEIASTYGDFANVQADVNELRRAGFIQCHSVEIGSCGVTDAGRKFYSDQREQ